MPDVNVVIAGAAGQGVQSAAAILGKTLMRLGFYVYTTQDYQSRVRGGHNYMRIRFSNKILHASVKRIDYLLALNEESLHIHMPSLSENGRGICMEADKGEFHDDRLRTLPVSVGPEKAQSPKFVGVKLLSLLFTMVGFERDVLKNAVVAHFKKRLKPEVLQLNVDAIIAASEFVQSTDVTPLPFKPDTNGARLKVTGNDAISLGMIAAGIGVYVGYPMTPSTTVLNSMATFGPKVGIAVEQVEDEVAALNVAIGAAYMGARAGTGSSGAGMGLMSEAMGLAGITETPVVIVNGQRSGPSTGMATRTEQGDLLFIAHASHGEFPRAIIAPADHIDGFYLSAEAFNIAERWHVPVFIMDDQAFADAESVVPEFDPAKVTIDRGPIAAEPSERKMLRRYQDTDTGVSPRAFPLLSDWLISADSHEHTEEGILSDDIDNRNRQHHKRMKKLTGIAAKFPAPQIVGDRAKTLLLCWGSTVGPVLEAAEILKEKGHSISVAVFRYLFPMNKKKIQAALSGFEQLITVEGNYTGQLGKLLQEETCIGTNGHIGKTDGRPFTVEDVVEGVERLLGGAS